jgi:hypothetical protein
LRTQIKSIICHCIIIILKGEKNSFESFDLKSLEVMKPVDALWCVTAYSLCFVLMHQKSRVYFTRKKEKKTQKQFWFFAYKRTNNTSLFIFFLSFSSASPRPRPTFVEIEGYSFLASIFSRQKIIFFAAKKYVRMSISAFFCSRWI